MHNGHGAAYQPTWRPSYNLALLPGGTETVTNALLPMTDPRRSKPVERNASDLDMPRILALPLCAPTLHTSVEDDIQNGIFGRHNQLAFA